MDAKKLVEQIIEQFGTVYGLSLAVYPEAEDELQRRKLALRWYRYRRKPETIAMRHINEVARGTGLKLGFYVER